MSPGCLFRMEAKDLTARVLKAVNMKIWFDDILEIEGEKVRDEI